MTTYTFLKWLVSHPLNKRTASGPLKAISRLARWQAACRLMPVGMTLPFVNSTVLLAERGMTGATGNWYCGLHEASEMGFVLHSLRENDLFVDVGANIGSYSILAAGAVGADVISIEPIPETYSRLERNVTLNNLTSQIRLYNLGVSSERTTLQFTKSLDTMNRLAIPGEDIECLDVEVTTLDDILGDRTANVVKIDVEGHELAALRGATLTLSNPALRAVILETNQCGERYGVDDHQLVNEMDRYGFSRFTYNPLTRRLIPIRSSSSNSIFVRDQRLI